MEEQKCPVCQDILSESDAGFFCENCGFKEPANGKAESDKDAVQGGKAKNKKKHSRNNSAQQKNKSVNEGVTEPSNTGNCEDSGEQPDKSVSRKIDLTNISAGMQKLAKVTFYGWKVGHARYRYGVIKPSHYVAAIEKVMSGREAFHLLTKIKNGNRHGRIETKVLLVL